MKEEDNLLNNYGYKYNYKNEIYKYYSGKDTDKNPKKEILEQPKEKKFNLNLIKEKIKKNFIRFKKWIDF